MWIDFFCDLEYTLIMKKILILLPILATFFISCKTIKEIPQEKSAAQIIQMGQNFATLGDYKSAEICYKEALIRFYADPQIFAEAKYELGAVYLKQKKYDSAFNEFSQLLTIYDENPAIYPSAYKKLANIGLSKIPKNKLQELTEKWFSRGWFHTPTPA